VVVKPAILFWAPYSYAGPSNLGHLGQILWHILRLYAN